MRGSIVLSETSELLLLAIVAAYGRTPGRCLPSTFKRRISRTSAEIADALDELIRESLLELAPDGSVVVTREAFDQPVFSACSAAAVAGPRVVAAFLLTARLIG